MPESVFTHRIATPADLPRGVEIHNFAIKRDLVNAGRRVDLTAPRSS
jgi:hypothetical protein